MIDDQIELIGLLVNLKKRINKKFDFYDKKFLIYSYHSNDRNGILFKVEENNISYYFSMDYYCNLDYLEVDYFPKLDYLEILFNECRNAGNIKQLLDDYKQMDIDQFILTYGRDPFNMNDLVPEVFLVLIKKSPLWYKIKRILRNINPFNLLKNKIL